MEVLGLYFGSLRDVFLEPLAIEVVFEKLRSRAGESSKIRVLGSLKLDKNRIKNAFGCGIVSGSQFSKKLCNLG